MEYISWAQIVFLGAGIAQAGSIGGYAAQLRRMNYQLNWEVTANWAPAHGLWMPYNLSSGQPHDGNWTSCLQQPDFASYYAGNRYSYVRDCWSLNYTTLNRSVLGYYWVGARRLLHLSLFLAASRMVLPKILVLTPSYLPTQLLARPHGARFHALHVRATAPVIQCGTRVLVPLLDSLMFGRVLK